MPSSYTDVWKSKEWSDSLERQRDASNACRREMGEVKEELEQSISQVPNGAREGQEFLLSQEEEPVKVLWEERKSGKPRQTKLRRKSRDCAELKALLQEAAQRDCAPQSNQGKVSHGDDLENILSYVSDGSGKERASSKQLKGEPLGRTPLGDNLSKCRTKKDSLVGTKNPFQTKQNKVMEVSDKSKILQLLDRVESVVNRKRKQVCTSQLLRDNGPDLQASMCDRGPGEFPANFLEQKQSQAASKCFLSDKGVQEVLAAPLDGSAPSMGCETNVELSLRLESQGVAEPSGATHCTANESSRILEEFGDEFFYFEEEGNTEHRFHVEVVTDMFGGAPIKLLKLNSIVGGEDCFVYLKDGWYSTPVQSGDVVNIFSESWTYEQFDGTIHQCCTLTYSEGILILHPDTILSITRLSTMFDCPRKAVLEERLGGGPSNKWAVLGTLVHELFQSYITMEQDVSDDGLSCLIGSIISNSLEKLCEIQSTETEMKMLMAETIPALRKWRQSFMLPQNTTQPEDFPGCRVDIGPNLGQRLIVEEVVDIEDNIWSIKLGVKGQIDATLKLKNYGQKQFAHSSMDELVPLELKTGLLFYSKTGETSGIPKLPIEVSSILQARNELVSWLKCTDNELQLPPLLESKHHCQRCPQLHNCMLFHNVHEGGTAESSGMSSAFEEATGVLASSHQAFLKKWERLIELERQVSLSRLSEVWAMDALQREKLGRCMPAMRLKSSTPGALLKYDMQERSHNKRGLSFAQAAGKDLYVTFENGDHRKQNCISASEITLGDRVIIGIDKKHVVLARGHVASLDSSSLTIRLTRPLRVPPHRQGNQLLSSDIILDKPVWRIDKDEVVSTMERLKSALLKLVLQKDGHTRKLCRLLVDRHPPRSKPISDTGPKVHTRVQTNGESNKATCSSWSDARKGINADQERVVAACLQKNDYLLVLGMPGTGKTTTISRCIRALVERGMSVLVAAYTNAAVDHLLQKLLEEGVDILRLGRADAVSLKIKEWVIGEKNYPVSSTACITSHLRRATVVGCTSLGAGSPLLENRGLFDVAIVDEASQITLPACLPPILAAKRFILVGDHNQLPPLVSSPVARKEGMDVSLFKQLSEAHPQAVISLQKQYRMCEEIQLLSNSLVYNGRLECANQEVAKSRLPCCPSVMQQAVLNTVEVILGRGALFSQDLEREAAWLSSAVDPQMPVVFLDTDRVIPTSYEMRKGESLVNAFEMSLVNVVVRTLALGGVGFDDIMVVSPFRSQAEALSKYLNEEKLDVLTVDKCQGRDKPCVLVSFVRSNEDREPGHLLADLRRLNVALTRAKSKLILVGSRTTLQNLSIFHEAFDLLAKNRWIVNVNTILPAFAVSGRIPGDPSPPGCGSTLESPP